MQVGLSAGPHWSERFQRRVWLTDHALARAAERKISVETLLDVIETSTLREREQGRCWIWKADALIVKTVMHHFDPEGT